MPVAGPQPPSTSCFARWILHRAGKHLHLWGGLGGIFMGAFQFTEKINSEVVAGSALLQMREAPPRALREHGVINGVAWAREGAWAWDRGHRGVRWLWVRTWTKSPFVWDAWERAAEAAGTALWRRSQLGRAPLRKPAPRPAGCGELCPTKPPPGPLISSLWLGCVYSTV